MINQLPITNSFIKQLETLCNCAGIGLNHVDKELKTLQGSVKDIIIETNEDGRQAIAMIKDFIFRATHDEYGELIK